VYNYKLYKPVPGASQDIAFFDNASKTHTLLWDCKTKS